jgi:hypothetical protein
MSAAVVMSRAASDSMITASDADRHAIRPATAPAMPATASTRAVETCVRPVRQCAAAATRLVAPTITWESFVASTGETARP